MSMRMRARVSQTRGQKTALMKATSRTKLSLKGGAGEAEDAARAHLSIWAVARLSSLHKTVNDCQNQSLVLKAWCRA